jgi:hypothetical protein
VVKTYRASAETLGKKGFKAMVTFEQIKSNLEDVTSEHTARCAKIWDFQNGEDFYLVESESDPTVEYKVQYSTYHGFTCNCKAGLAGFSHVTRHPSGVCKHCRWAVATWLEDEALEQALEEANEALAEKVAKMPTIILPIVRPLNVSSIEASMPAWVMNARPSRGMDRAPREI